MDQAALDRIAKLEKQMAAMIDRYNYVATTQEWLRFKLLELLDGRDD